MLAHLQNEPGRDAVREAFGRGAVISTVNLAEVLTRLADGGQDPYAVRQALADAGLLGQLLTVSPFNEAQAIGTAQLRAATRSAGLSLGDRACLALARTMGVPALTADRAWASLSVGVEIEVVR